MNKTRGKPSPVSLSILRMTQAEYISGKEDSHSQCDTVAKTREDQGRTEMRIMKLEWASFFAQSLLSCSPAEVRWCSALCPSEHPAGILPTVWQVHFNLTSGHDSLCLLSGVLAQVFP